MKTQVIVDNKQTIVVGGIYETTSQHIHERVPFLSSIPLLGRLFKHDVSKESRRELLIFITPEIIGEA
jgi:type IV pilus assembly protein PilQ